MAQRDDKVSISIRISGALHRRLVDATAKVDGSLNSEIQRRLALSFDEANTGCQEVVPQLTRIEHQVNAIALALLSPKKGN